jgi:hypothetical protein
MAHVFLAHALKLVRPVTLNPTSPPCSAGRDSCTRSNCAPVSRAPSRRCSIPAMPTGRCAQAP